MTVLSILDQAPVAEGLTPADALANTIDLARRVDSLGYHRYWVAEHHGMSSHAIAAPEVLVGAIAAQTTSLRVGSGGVLLGHYSPFKVAEVFRTISTLYPGRIDLGIGRSTGADTTETLALNPFREHDLEIDDKVKLLRGLLEESLPAEHPLAKIDVTPAGAITPEIWLLGSSSSSAATAAALGVDYAYAHFINPGATRSAVAAYQQGRAGRSPIVAVSVVLAETDQEAQRLFATQRAVRNRLLRGDASPLPTPEQAQAELVAHGDVLATERFPWPRYFAGRPDKVGTQLREFSTALGIDELIVVTTVYDHEDRVRSYELLAQEFTLTNDLNRTAS